MPYRSPGFLHSELDFRRVRDRRPHGAECEKGEGLSDTFALLNTTARQVDLAIFRLQL